MQYLLFYSYTQSVVRYVLFAKQALNPNPIMIEYCLFYILEKVEYSLAAETVNETSFCSFS